MSHRLRLFGFLVLLNVSLMTGLTGCFGKKSETSSQTPTPVLKVVKKEAVVKDKELQALARYFGQADAIHREAWRIMTNVKLPASKTPFGKLQRAALSAQNIKLTNKSLFSCDRYLMKRDVLSPSGIPQRADVLEKCSEKSEARKIAEWSYEKNEVIKITFFADHLQEVLGVGATIINRTMECELKGSRSEVLQSFSCKKWAQDKSAEEMIRLDTYEYQKENKDLLRLKGKVYVNLSEARKIEVSVPLTGRIQVVETELYAPEEEVKPPVKSAADPKAPMLPPGQVRGARPDLPGAVQSGQGVRPPGQSSEVIPLPASPSARHPREDVHESGEAIQQPAEGEADGNPDGEEIKALPEVIPDAPENPESVGSPDDQIHGQSPEEQQNGEQDQHGAPEAGEQQQWQQPQQQR